MRRGLLRFGILHPQAALLLLGVAALALAWLAAPRPRDLGAAFAALVVGGGALLVGYRREAAAGRSLEQGFAAALGGLAGGLLTALLVVAPAPFLYADPAAGWRPFLCWIWACLAALPGIPAVVALVLARRNGSRLSGPGSAA